MCHLTSHLLVIIDWIVRRANEDKPRGIVWELINFLEDCDFADDLALLSHAQKDIQEKITKIEQGTPLCCRIMKTEQESREPP